MASRSSRNTESGHSRPAPEYKRENSLVKAYLVAYNVSQMLGWSVLLVIMVNHIVTQRSIVTLYKQVEGILQICQTAAILEILHSMTGIVRSNWVLTAFQVYSRVFLIWGIVWSVPAVQSGNPILLWLSAWAITEIIRYSYYFFSLLPGPVPRVLVWSRYSLFIILYPIGVTGELLTIFAALPFVKESKLYNLDMPNVWNIAFNYYYYLCFIIISYLPVFPQLYLHMFSQRSKILNGALDVDKKDK